MKRHVIKFINSFKCPMKQSLFIIIIIVFMNFHSFEDHKKYYESIPIQERSSFLKELLKIPQIEGVPTIHYTPFPSQSSFNYHSYKLNYHYSETTSNPKAIVVFLHGLYSYGGNSGYLGVNMTQSIEGVNFYSLDFMNFGKSSGDCRGYIRSFQYLVEQGEAFIDYLLQKFTQKPSIFLVGQSLGGAVVFKMSVKHPQRYKGVIFLNPALREIKQSQFIMKKIGKIIGYLTPKLKLTHQSFSSTTKYDTEKIVKSNLYLYNDRHVPGSVRAALNAMEEIETLYSQFKCPYILFQGGVDKSVDIFAPLDLEKQCKSKDKTTVYIKSLWHSVFYQLEVTYITDMVITWLSKRI